ncbi:Caleosin related protein-domain-containing protein [Pilaira anomala]|nr:Caleosin related protein-domain-containing protein [Pilaira anomala]
MSLLKVSNTLSQMNENKPVEESGIQKHVKFWDRKHKGYITPLDTISGFITLGYGTLFSIAIGAFVGIFLSVSTQKGWFPDPLCRSNVRSLVRSKKKIQSNQGAYDANGLFVPEKFESLFNKYAQSDKSGKTITVAELIRMTQEQEKLGKDIKAWTKCMIELSTAYFFIGHRGYLTKEDVRSAYDGTLFYRLRDTHRLLIKQGSVAHIDSTGPSLGGSYLATSHGFLSPKGIESRMRGLLNAIQSKSSAAMANYHLHDWVSYVMESTESIKNTNIIPRVIMRSPTSIIRGVTTPKSSMYKSTKHENPATLFPDGITGVAKPEGESVSTDSTLLDSLLRNNDVNDVSEKEAQSTDIEEKAEQDYIKNSNNEEPKSHFINDDSFVVPTPKKSVSTITSNSLFQNGFLKDETDKWPNQSLTGVKDSNIKKSEDSISSSSFSTVSNDDSNSEIREYGNMENVSSKKIEQIPTKESPPPPQLTHKETRTVEVPISVITPPPEEKSTDNSLHPKSQPVSGKKTTKAKNKKNKTTGQEIHSEDMKSMAPIAAGTE